MGTLYSYGVHRNLKPAELFFFIAADETCGQLGIDDIEAVIIILSGINFLPTRAKPFGATKGTSVASVAARSLITYELKAKILPTLTLGSIKQLRWLMTHKLSVFVGRTIPGIGWVLLASDVYQIMRNTVLKYNRSVKSEDQVF